MMSFAPIFFNRLGQVDEGQSCGSLAAKRCRFTTIATVADALNKRNLCQKGHVHLLCKFLTTFLAKDVVFVLRQFSRGEPCHVLNESEDGHVHLFVAIHIDTLASICQGHLLRGRNDDSTSDGEGLQKGQMNVGSAWRSVEDEIVELAPVGISNELFQGIGSHSTSPKRSCFGRYEETNGEQLDTIGLDGFDELTSVYLNSIRTGILHVEHLGHGRTKDIGIKQTNLVAQASKGDGQIGRNSALAHATFSRADSNNILHLRQ